jgi:hypothetical protein
MVDSSPEHIKPLRLFELSRGERRHAGKIREAEEQHLRECKECERIVEVFAREFKDLPGRNAA